MDVLLCSAQELLKGKLLSWSTFGLELAYRESGEVFVTSGDEVGEAKLFKATYRVVDKNVDPFKPACGCCPPTFVGNVKLEFVSLHETEKVLVVPPNNKWDAFEATLSASHDDEVLVVEQAFDFVEAERLRLYNVGEDEWMLWEG